MLKYILELILSIFRNFIFYLGSNPKTLLSVFTKWDSLALFWKEPRVDSFFHLKLLSGGAYNISSGSLHHKPQSCSRAGSSRRLMSQKYKNLLISVFYHTTWRFHNAFICTVALRGDRASRHSFSFFLSCEPWFSSWNKLLKIQNVTLLST